VPSLESLQHAPPKRDRERLRCGMVTRNERSRKLEADQVRASNFRGYGNTRHVAHIQNSRIMPAVQLSSKQKNDGSEAVGRATCSIQSKADGAANAGRSRGIDGAAVACTHRAVSRLSLTVGNFRAACGGGVVGVCPSSIALLQVELYDMRAIRACRIRLGARIPGKGSSARLHAAKSPVSTLSISSIF
jgi:hypothetical protein